MILPKMYSVHAVYMAFTLTLPGAGWACKIDFSVYEDMVISQLSG